MNRLIEIQKKLKSPKGQYNSFGKYKYRNCEDILECVKPLLSEVGLALIINDEIIQIDGGYSVEEKSKDKTKIIVASNRVYVKATAILYDKEGKEVAKSSALAREEETKTGMDSMQLTGATSSYARKYALNGLFAIDDTKDADATNTHGKKKEDKEDKEEARTEPIIVSNNDLDLIIELESFDTIGELVKFFNEHKNEAENFEEFNKVFQAKRKSIMAKGA